MRFAFPKLVVMIGLILGAIFAYGDGIGPGSTPPALDVKTWYKGSAVTEFEQNKTYVVEFWATWCGPCIQSIPHLTEMAKKNTDVTFIGISIWEDDKDSNIKNFIDKMGEKMDYHVGYSGNKTGMSVSWMEAAGQNGIPAAFIIKNNAIQWIGHPIEMEKPLEEIKAGTFDRAAFKAAFEKGVAATRTAIKIQSEQTAINVLIKAGKLSEAHTRIDQFEAKNPPLKLDDTRFLLMSKQDVKAWTALVKKTAEKSDSDSTQRLFSFAMDQTQKDGNLAQGNLVMETSLKYAKKDDVMRFYLAAVFYDDSNNSKKALDCMDKALVAFPLSGIKGNKQAKEDFEKMRAAFAAKVSGKSKGN